jgi:hypothetical protein
MRGKTGVEGPGIPADVKRGKGVGAALVVAQMAGKIYKFTSTDNTIEVIMSSLTLS